MSLCSPTGGPASTTAHLQSALTLHSGSRANSHSDLQHILSPPIYSLRADDNATALPETPTTTTTTDNEFTATRHHPSSTTIRPLHIASERALYPPFHSNLDVDRAEQIHQRERERERLKSSLACSDAAVPAVARAQNFCLRPTTDDSSTTDEGRPFAGRPTQPAL